MHPATTEALMIVFIALAAIALLGQFIVLLGVMRKVNALSEEVAPLLPLIEQAAKALPGLVRDGQALLAETRPKLQAITTNLADVTARVRDQVQRADQFATQFSEKLELQMVRVDEALGTAIASVEQVTSAVRDTILRPVQDVNAVFQGLRTGLDFFFRRRGSPPRRPQYQDEEMFI
ncbi:MAG TPA: hypothetical protein VN709_13715 [Terriglobales bacterium]|nr:hypothetical protein [Terriglobales bacterium]